jgi:hypothetical protein
MPWLEIDEDARNLAKELQERRRAIKEQKLELFNATSSAERALSTWISDHQPRNEASIDKDPTGQKLIAHRQAQARLYLEALAAADLELASLRQQLRKHLIEPTSDPNFVSAVKDSLVDLRLRAAADSVSRHNDAESQAEQAVRSTLQRMLGHTN